MSFVNTLGMKVGEKDASGTYVGSLGKIVEIDGSLFRYVKATGTMAAGSGGLFLATVEASGIRTWAVAVNGVINNRLVMGVIPAIDTKGVTVNTTAFAAGDVFLAQINGDTQVQVASSGVIATAAIGASIMADTNGLAALAISSADVVAAIFRVGNATNTTAATSGTLRTVRLECRL